MRTLVLIGLAGIALAGAAGDAQARARFRGWHGHAPVAPGPASAALRGRAPDAARPTYVLLPGAVATAGAGASSATAAMPEPALPGAVPGSAAPSVPAQADPHPQAPKAVAEDAPWCRSGRVVGTGRGFCMVN